MADFEDTRPTSVFSESSEPDRLFIHEDINETLSFLEQPHQSHTSWNPTNSSQTPVTSHLFRPFLPVASPQYDASQSVTPIHHHQYLGIASASYTTDVNQYSTTSDVKPYRNTIDVEPFSQTPDVSNFHTSDVTYSHTPDVSNIHTPDVTYSHTPDVTCSHAQDVTFSHMLDVTCSHPQDVTYTNMPDVKPLSNTPNIKPYSNTPDDEVSYIYNHSRSEDSTDSYHNPGSNRSRTITPSSVPSSHSGTPTELDVTEWSANECETIIRTQDYQPNQLKGKARKRKETMRGSFPYKRHPKPPYTYCGMIATAIMLSQQKRLTLGGIHKKLRELFEFFRGPYTGWRHSVRHNLSYNDCFFKGDLVIDSIEEKRNVYNWGVDHTKIPYGSLCLQRTVEGRTGEYQEHIHEQLSIPVGIYGYNIWPLCRCKRLNVEPEKKMNVEPLRPAENSSFRRHLRLPVMIDCTLPTESPETYRSRDVTNNSSFHEQDENQSASPVLATGSHHISRIMQSSGGPTGFGSISRYIMSTDGSDWTSSAAENLSFLCQTPYGS